MTKEELLVELAKRGIKIDIGGCGCCNSPWIKIVIDDKTFESEGDSLTTE